MDRSQHMAHDRPFIVPVVIDEVSQADARVPERFSERQWTRLPAGENAAAGRSRRGLHLTGGLIALDVIVIAGLIFFAARVRPGPPPATAPATMSAADHSMPASGAAPTNPSAPAPPASAIPEKSIAVLPFEDMSERHDQEYFSEGLAEELLDQLAQFPDLKVASRTSTFYFKDKPVEIGTIAAELRVANVLEGSVRKSGATTRVTAQLIRADSGYHVWSMTFDRDAKKRFVQGAGRNCRGGGQRT